MTATGPAARPGQTPIPWRGAAASEAVVGAAASAVIEASSHAGSSWSSATTLGDSLEGFRRAVAVGLEDDGVAVPRAERQDPEDAARIDRRSVALSDRDLHRLLRRGLDEERGRSRVKTDPGADDDLTFCHDVVPPPAGLPGCGSGQGSIVTLMPSPRETIPIASSTPSSGSRWVMRSLTGTSPLAIRASACLL